MDDPVEQRRRRRAYAYTAAAAAGVVVYGSLFPFDFSASAAAAAWQDGIPLGWSRPSRGDVMANLILYLPFGTLAMLALAAHLSRAASAVLTVMCGTTISLAVELVQSFVPERIPSYFDLVLNAASTGIGVAAAIYWQRALRTPPAWLRASTWMREPREPLALLAVLLWLAAHTAPFVPHADVGSAWAALRPMREFALTGGGMLKYFATALVLATILRTVLRRERFWSGFLCLAVLGLAARVLFVRQNLGPNEPLGMLVALPVIAILRTLPTERTAGTILLLSGSAWLAYGLAPFDFSGVPQSFEWRPFGAFLTGDVESGYLTFLEKSAFFVGWAWIATSARIRLAPVLVFGTTALAAVEAAQCWLPGRVGESTDPVLFAIAALAVGALGSQVRAHSMARGTGRAGAADADETRSDPGGARSRRTRGRGRASDQEPPRRKDAGTSRST